MKIGVDFGTTYSKIAYVDEHGLLKLFLYPGVAGKAYIPTAIAYGQEPQRTFVGEAARAAVLNQRAVTYCENFKMLLPIREPAEWKQHGWSSDRSPEEVTADYLRHLLCADRQSVEKENGPIENLVVSVPEIWQKTAANRGADTLQRVVTGALNLPLDCLRSEPVCAAAYYVFRCQENAAAGGKSFRGHLLVCDMGGGTFDVALVHVAGAHLTVLDFAGNGSCGIGLAGEAFDRNAVSIATEATTDRSQSDDSGDFLRLVRSFEQEKINSHEYLSDFLDVQGQYPGLLAQSALYTISGEYDLRVDQVEVAFDPIRQGIREVIGQVQSTAQERGQRIDRVVIVGGFGLFPLVQRTILDCLGITDAQDERFDAALNSAEISYAVAYGAALLANDMINVEEYYPHTIGLKAHRLRYGSRLLASEEFVPLIQAGKTAPHPGRPQFLRKGDADTELVQVEVLGNRGELPVYLRLLGCGEMYAIRTATVDYPDQGFYWIGLQIDRSNLAKLFFRPIEGGSDRVYDLGRLSFELVVKEA